MIKVDFPSKWSSLKSDCFIITESRKMVNSFGFQNNLTRKVNMQNKRGIYDIRLNGMMGNPLLSTNRKADTSNETVMLFYKHVQVKLFWQGNYSWSSYETVLQYRCQCMPTYIWLGYSVQYTSNKESHTSNCCPFSQINTLTTYSTYSP